MLENTHTRAGGTTLSPEQTEALAAAAQRHGCRVHIDGARLVNAAVALGVPLADLAAPANSVVISLNKSLSAPFGAVLAGSEAVVERAREMLHRLGGASFHRAGIAAAAGLVALDTMLDRVADDHRRARSLGGGARGDPGRDAAAGGGGDEHRARRRERDGDRARGARRCSCDARACGVLERDTSRIRLVTHRLIGDAEVEQAVATVADVVERHAVPVPVVPELDYDWEAELEAYVDEEESAGERNPGERLKPLTGSG